MNWFAAANGEQIIASYTYLVSGEAGGSIVTEGRINIFTFESGDLIDGGWPYGADPTTDFATLTGANAITLTANADPFNPQTTPAGTAPTPTEFLWTVSSGGGGGGGEAVAPPCTSPEMAVLTLPVYAALGAAIILVFLNPQNASTLLALTNQIQLLACIVALDQGSPQKIIDYVNELGFAKLDFSPEYLQEFYFNLGLDWVAENIGWLVVLEDWAFNWGPSPDATIPGVAYLEYESAVMVNNEQTPFILLVRTAIVHLICVLVGWILYFFHKGKSCRERNHSTFHFSAYLLIYLEAMVFVTLLSFADLEYQLGTSFDNWFSCVMSFFCLIVVVLTLVLVPIHYCKYQNNEDVLREGKFFILYDGLKVDRWWNGIYMSFFLWKRFFICLLFVALRRAGWYLNLLPIFLLQIGHFIFVAVARPFETWKDNAVEFLIEFFLALIVLCHMIWSGGWSTGAETFGIILLSVNNFCITIVIYIDLIIQLTLWIKGLFKKCENKKMRRSRFNGGKQVYIRNHIDPHHDKEAMEIPKYEDASDRKMKEPEEQMNGKKDSDPNRI